MARKGESPQKRQDALIALAGRGRGGAFGGNATPIVTGNGPPGIFFGPFSPGVAPGSTLLAADFTPLKSGLLFLSTLLNFVAVAPDTITLSVEWADLLTTFTGGTVIVPGLRGRIGSDIVTVPVDTTNPPVAVASGNTTVQGGQNLLGISLARIPIQAVPGHRTLVAIRGVSINNTSWEGSGTFALEEG